MSDDAAADDAAKDDTALDDTATDGMVSRLQRIEDRIEIEELVARYCVAVDDHDFDALRELLSADMRWEGSRSVSGRDAVVADLRASTERIVSSVHTPEFVILEDLDDHTASGVVGAHVELILGGQLVVGYLRYHDTYVREAGRWRFASREQRFQYVAPWAEVAEAIASDHPVRWPGRARAVTGLPTRSA